MADPKQRLRANPLDLMGLAESLIEDGEPEVVERIVEVVPANALIALGDGSMQFGNYTLTTRGLIGGEDAEPEQWQLLGNLLQKLEGAIQWLIGDWVLQAERKWGATYETVAEKTGYAYDTLKDYAYVARNVEMSVRTDQLSFGHHKLVAAMPVDEQRAWLDWALSQNASISQLRKKIHPPTPPSTKWGEEEQKVNVTGQFLLQNKAKVAAMPPGKRREYIENAEQLADYYARLAAWARRLE